MTPPPETRARHTLPWLALALLFALGHLCQLDRPPLDHQGWRQADTASVARNFAEESANPLYPRIDRRDEHSGIVGMELPLYNYLLFLINALVGFAHWHGRPLSLAFGLACAWCFFDLAHRRYGAATAALASAALMTSPLFFTLASAIQPDMMSLAFAVGSLLCLDRFCETSRRRDFFLSCGLLSLAALTKAPMLHVGLVHLLILWRARRPRALELVAGGALVVVPAAVWYLHALSLGPRFGKPGYFNLDDDRSALLSMSYWATLYLERLPLLVASVPALLLAGAGLSGALRRRDTFTLAWLGSALLYLAAFPLKAKAHDYYALPLVPAIAALAGIGAAAVAARLQGRRRAKIALAALVVGLSLAQLTLQAREAFRPRRPELARLEALLDHLVDRRALVVTDNDRSPIMLYFAHRKGWSVNWRKITPDLVCALGRRGARYVVVQRRDAAYDAVLERLPADALHRDADFVILQVRRACALDARPDPSRRP